MKNSLLMAGLSLAIVAGSAAIAANERVDGTKHGPRHSFEELDSNGDGKLMPQELEAHWQARFKKADTDGNGVLTQEELMARFSERKAERASKIATHMIERHDADGDGALTMAEMQSRHKGKMFARMDADEDGVVTAKEFDEMRAKHRKHGGKRYKKHNQSE